MKGQDHSLALTQDHSDFQIKTCFPKKLLGELKPFLWEGQI